MKPLRRKMLNDLCVRNLAENTQQSYLNAVTGLAQYYHRSPDQLSSQEVQDYLLYLSQEKHLAWQSCNTIRYGLQFFYYVTLAWPATRFYLPSAKEPSKLPEILSHEELVRLFTVATNRKHRALLMTTYAAGLRASEVTRLRLKDIDSGRRCIRVEQGKGRKDRYVPLAPRLLTQLRDYWREKRPPEWLFPNHRLMSFENDQVHFRWRDYAHGNRQKILPLSAEEFLRRFLLHTLPAGFVRIRHYGLLGNRCRHEKLARCRALLGQHEPQPLEPESVEAMMMRLVGIDIQCCPFCQQGQWRVIAELAPIRTFPPIPKVTGPPR